MLKEHEIRRAILEQYPNIPKHHIHRIAMTYQEGKNLAIWVLTYIRHNVLNYDQNQHGYSHFHVSRRAFADRDFDKESKDILNKWRGVQHEYPAKKG